MAFAPTSCPLPSGPLLVSTQAPVTGAKQGACIAAGTLGNPLPHPAGLMQVCLPPCVVFDADASLELRSKGRSTLQTGVPPASTPRSCPPPANAPRCRSGVATHSAWPTVGPSST